jgi:hypothetical protein
MTTSTITAQSIAKPTIYDRVYQGSYVATTLAFVALNYYSISFNSFRAAAMGLAFTKVFVVDGIYEGLTAAQKIKSLSVVASLIGSSASSALVAGSFYSLLEGANALKNYEFDNAISYLAAFSLIVGYGIPAAAFLYARGLEILRMAEFKPMEFYIKEPPAYKNMISLFLDKVGFFLGVLSPDALEYFPFLGRVQIMTIPFCSEELLAERISRLEATCSRYPPAQAALLWRSTLSYLFLQNEKWDYLPRIVDIGNRLPPPVRLEIGKLEDNQGADSLIFPKKIQQVIADKQTDIRTNFHEKVNGLEREVNALAEKLAKSNPNEEAELNERAKQLLIEITTLYQNTKTFIPELSVEKLQACIQQLQRGDIHVKLQVIRSKISAGEGIDNSQETWDYFLSIVEPEQASYRKLLKLLAIREQEHLVDTLTSLNGALKRYGIATIGEFTSKVLKNDTALLNTPSKALDQLKNYLKNDRNLLYQELAGTAKVHANKFVFVAARVTYLAVMTLISLTPLYTGSLRAACGFMGSLIYYASPSLQDVIRLLSLYFPNPFDLTTSCRLATRRPFFGLFRGHPALMDTYDTASLTGKLRILGLELMYANTLLQNEQLGSAIAGAAIGREVWGEYFWPQNVRREYFI